MTAASDLTWIHEAATSCKATPYAAVVNTEIQRQESGAQKPVPSPRSAAQSAHSSQQGGMMMKDLQALIRNELAAIRSSGSGSNQRAAAQAQPRQWDADKSQPKVPLSWRPPNAWGPWESGAGFTAAVAANGACTFGPNVHGAWIIYALSQRWTSPAHQQTDSTQMCRGAPVASGSPLLPHRCRPGQSPTA